MNHYRIETTVTDLDSGKSEGHVCVVNAFHDSIANRLVIIGTSAVGTSVENCIRALTDNRPTEKG